MSTELKWGSEATNGVVSGAQNLAGKTGYASANMYAAFGTGQTPGGTVDLAIPNLQKSLELNIHDPAGSASRGREYYGGWAGMSNPNGSNAGGDYKGYNQFFMTVAQNFDPFMQKKEAMHPHWWLNRIPRGAYQLGNGTVQETRIYRGGLSTYAGLDKWEDLVPSNYLENGHDACGPMPYSTYDYAWEALAWSGKKAAWGSDPICIDVLKFVPKAVEQIGWILETGVKFGTDMQNVWNRDMFVFQSVMAGRSFVMTNEYRGDASPRYVYNPFCKFVGDNGVASDLHANAIDKPFIVIDASVDMEPLNFDVLDIVRSQLKRRCPEAAVGRIGTEPMFALAISEEDVEKYVRGNEEERKYWIEANPQALIQHYGFAPTTFRRWTITCDDEQLRFKLVKFIPNYTDDIALTYGNVGKKELSGKAVYIAEVVMPEVAVRQGINGAPIPGPNPEYDMAEIAICPIFMNKVFTNLFVPDMTNIGHGTYFGPKKGLNGKWAWYNIQTKENPDQRVGNFYGELQIVPKPDLCIYDTISFVYRRCTVPLRSLCPAENYKVNKDIDPASPKSTKTSADAAVSAGVATLELNSALAAGTGAIVTIENVGQAYVLSVGKAGAQITVQLLEAGDDSGSSGGTATTIPADTKVTVA